MALDFLKGHMASFTCYRPYGLMKSKGQNDLNSCKAEMALIGRTAILVLIIIIIIIIIIIKFLIYIYIYIYNKLKCNYYVKII